GGSGERDHALRAVPGVTLAQPAAQRFRELPALAQLLDDVGASDELAADEDLGDGRPARERRELLADLRVGEDVDGRHRGAGLAERPERAFRVAAHDERRRALHEEGDGLRGDDLLDLGAKVGHAAPLVLMRSSWIDPSASGSASAAYTR